MSKMAMLKQYRYSPAAGGFLSFLTPVVKGIGSLFKSKTAQTVIAAAKSPAGRQVVGALGAGAGLAAGQALLASGRGGAGASGAWGPKRRAKGITARELRGYRKVANLLHKEGMVSRRARRGK